MATQRITTVQGNTAPPLLLTAKRSGTAIDVTGATVDVIIAKGGVQVNTGHTLCTIVTPTSGIVSYTPQAGDFATPGTYKADLRVTYADATVETLYDQLLIKARKHL
jgi:hypothetical protein